MNRNELYEYIKNRKYYCVFCSDLKKIVMEKGVDEIPKYNGMQCGSIEDMKLRYYKISENNE